MRQPDSQEAPPKNQHQEMNSDGELTRHELELELNRREMNSQKKLQRDELQESSREMNSQRNSWRKTLTEDLKL